MDGGEIAGLAAKEFHDLHGRAELAERVDFENVQGFDARDSAVGVFLEQGIEDRAARG